MKSAVVSSIVCLLASNSSARKILTSEETMPPYIFSVKTSNFNDVMARSKGKAYGTEGVETNQSTQVDTTNTLAQYIGQRSSNAWGHNVGLERSEQATAKHQETEIVVIGDGSGQVTIIPVGTKNTAKVGSGMVARVDNTGYAQTEQYKGALADGEGALGFTTNRAKLSGYKATQYGNSQGATVSSVAEMPYGNARTASQAIGAQQSVFNGRYQDKADTTADMTTTAETRRDGYQTTKTTGSLQTRVNLG